MRVVRKFIKCPCCGHNVPRRLIIRGRLRQSLQSLTQTFVGRPYGTNGGAFIWKRLPMNHEELQLAAETIAAATAALEDARNDQLPDLEPPERVLAELDDDEEAEQIGLSWIEEAREELARRERDVKEALEFRRRTR